MRAYDLVVVGSGAGLSVLEEALQAGLSCALVERTLLGGTCLTRGCIPSKILVHPADVIREAEHARRIGLNLQVAGLDWPTLTKRMRSQIDQNQDIEETVLEQEGVDLFKGTAEFTGPDTLRVLYPDGTYSEPFQGRKILLAAGGRSFIPPISGLADAGYLDAESFFGDRFPERPWRSLVVIGGGAIGSEFAHVFSAFGTRVTVVELLPELVSTEEPEIRRMLADTFRQNGIQVLTAHRAVSARRNGDGKVVVVESTVTGLTSEIHCDEILIAAGIRSNADLLHLEHTSIRTDAQGWIVTDPYLQTTQNNVWAIGDINGKYQFRHKANYEAGICAANMLGGPDQRMAAEYDRVPWAIFTWPQIAHVGLTEAQVQATGQRYLVGLRHYSSVANGFAMGYEPGDPDDGFVKLIADEQFRILGAHVVGPQAAVLIQSLVYLMNTGYTCRIEPRKGLFKPAREVCQAGGTLMPLQDAMVIHPALSEVVGWVTGTLEWAGLPHEHHEHSHDHSGHVHDHDHSGHVHGHDHDHSGHVHGHDHDHIRHDHDGHGHDAHDHGYDYES